MHTYEMPYIWVSHECPGSHLLAYSNGFHLVSHLYCSVINLFLGETGRLTLLRKKKKPFDYGFPSSVCLASVIAQGELSGSICTWPQFLLSFLGAFFWSSSYRSHPLVLSVANCWHSSSQVTLWSLTWNMEEWFSSLDPRDNLLSGFSVCFVLIWFLLNGLLFSFYFLVIYIFLNMIFGLSFSSSSVKILLSLLPKFVQTASICPLKLSFFFPSVYTSKLHSNFWLAFQYSPWLSNFRMLFHNVACLCK